MRKRMAKLLKKHFGLGSKKANSGSQRSEYSTQKSSSAQDLIPQNLTRLQQSSVVLSASSHHEFLDTHSLKSVASDSGGCGHSTWTRTHEHGGCCKHHGCCRHQASAAASQRSSTSNDLGCRSAIHSGSVVEESDVFDETPSDVTDVVEMALPNSEVMRRLWTMWIDYPVWHDYTIGTLDMLKACDACAVMGQLWYRVPIL